MVHITLTSVSSKNRSSGTRMAPWMPMMAQLSTTALITTVPTLQHDTEGRQHERVAYPVTGPTTLQVCYADRWLLFALHATDAHAAPELLGCWMTANLWHCQMRVRLRNEAAAAAPAQAAAGAAGS